MRGQTWAGALSSLRAAVGGFLWRFSAVGYLLALVVLLFLMAPVYIVFLVISMIRGEWADALLGGVMDASFDLYNHLGEEGTARLFGERPG